MFALIMIGACAASDVAAFWQELPRRDFSGYERVLTQGSVLWHYISLYFFPWPDRLQLGLNAHWPIARGLLGAPLGLTLAWAAWIGVALLAWRARFACPWVLSHCSSSLVASSVESSFVNLEMVFEHRLYLTGLFIAPALIALVPWSRLRGLHGPVLWLLIILLALGTIERNRQWAQFEGFWVEELERGASPGRAAINAALRYNRLGRPEEALALLEGVSRRQRDQPEARAATRRGATRSWSPCGGGAPHRAGSRADARVAACPLFSRPDSPSAGSR
ncbi:MAG: hypothetical protein U5K33_07590 [Halofilum sp. (in: g-proteobacteria)]|nr:hypothetical protein [Halofilum sp. (in: g-proteobacteria)]